MGQAEALGRADAHSHLKLLCGERRRDEAEDPEGIALVP